MVKRRPCVVISPPIRGRPRLCTIVPLSTTSPKTIGPHHLLIELDPPLPRPFDNPRMWAKADMVLTVAFHRLRLFHTTDPQGGRRYDTRVLDAGTFERLKACVRAGLGL
jgi:uncharacterized protein YifN (PemK superfamily)